MIGDLNSETDCVAMPKDNYDESSVNECNSFYDNDNTNDLVEDNVNIGGQTFSLNTKVRSLVTGVRKVSFAGDTMKETNNSDSTNDNENQGDADVRMLHPVYSGISLAPNYANDRKLSPKPIGFIIEPSNRKPSSDVLFYQQHVPMHSQHKKISVFSIGNLSDTGTVAGEYMESLPQIEHYRVSVCDNQRPTLYQLMEDVKQSVPKDSSHPSELFDDELKDDPNVDVEKNQNTIVNKTVKFGWIQGVLFRCMLSTFGLMLFLRLSWVAGQAGIGLGTVIVALSVTVTSLTAMSMSAICTNGEVQGGGAYFMISRSLGPEFGGSIGAVLSLANAIASAMYIVGFAETVRDLLWEHGAQITGDSINEVRVIGLITSCLCLAIVIIGLQWEVKAQLVLLLIISVATLNYFIGTFIPPTDEKKWKGVVGYNADTFKINFMPHFTSEHNFFSVFSIFFPASTGVLAGPNFSGDLKDPQRALPKGTFLAILITTIVYLAFIWTFGGCVLLAAVGTLPSSMFAAGVNETMNAYIPTSSLVQDCFKFNKSCESGLLHEMGMVGIVSGWRPLTLAGIFAATLSSALASYVGGPKTFQALAKDKLLPWIHVFSKGYGPTADPRRGYILCFVICTAMVCIGSLDLIAPIITNFFLMTYALVNFSCFDASVVNSPGFRPTFKYYNQWLSLAGSILCIGIMFLINWWAALITFFIVGGLYFYIYKTKPDVNWGSSTQARAYKLALKSTLKLVNVDEHVKNFRPQILLLSGYPRNRSSLVKFASLITKKQSLLICGHVFQGELMSHVTQLMSKAAYRWFKNRKISAFYNSVCAPTFRIGVQVLLQALGVGRLRPNTLLMGYKTNWQKSEPDEVLDYFNVIQDAFDQQYAVGIYRTKNEFDRNIAPDDGDLENPYLSDSEENENNFDDKSTNTVDKKDKKDSNYIQSMVSGDHIVLKRMNTLQEGEENKAFQDQSTKTDVAIAQTPNILKSPEDQETGFSNKQFDTIDIWWLYDDGATIFDEKFDRFRGGRIFGAIFTHTMWLHNFVGDHARGLTLLIPYILHQRKKWRHAKLRIFCLGENKNNEDKDRTRYASLLSKFRIQYSELTVISELKQKPQMSTYHQFEGLIHHWRIKVGESQKDYPWKISDTDLIKNKSKTYRQLRLREKLLEHSKNASLIVLTLPVPKKRSCPAGLYMGWLEILTKDMSSILLIRGNQESVLSYYS